MSPIGRCSAVLLASLLVPVVQNALRVPMKTIASNAGVEGAVIVGKVGRMDACF